jgi:mannose-1-phosphate guanylyltransferase / mannose-6-phosphate isomerase
MLLHPVILSGGAGTRLWPMSREKHPKQLLALINEETMLQATAKRVLQFKGSLDVAEQFIVVCNEEYRFITAEQLRCVDILHPTLILEPFGRNTAPALTLAAIEATKCGDDAVLLIMPADHEISDNGAFHTAIEVGLAQAINGAIITFGISPNRPETGYGYIRVDQEKNDSTLRSVQAFVEKPPTETAKKYFDEGNYLWNSGIFMMRASVWLKAIQHFQPEISIKCADAMDKAKTDSDFIRIKVEHFRSCPNDSIDYAVMEKLPRSPEIGISCFVVALNAGWSDLGAWDAVWMASKKDQDGNSTHGQVVMEDSRNSLVFANSRLVTCLGLNDVVVIETPDAVLVTNMQSTQNIKRVVSRLKDEKLSQTDQHRKVYRPWGHYDSIDSGEHFQVKRIVVKPGGRLSMQLHRHRAEHWIVVCGQATVTRGEEVMTMNANQSTYIPLGVKHRLENNGNVDLELIEVQSGTYLGEDDIVRFDDIYGRTSV